MTSYSSDLRPGARRVVSATAVVPIARVFRNTEDFGGAAEAPDKTGTPRTGKARDFASRASRGGTSCCQEIIYAGVAKCPRSLLYVTALGLLRHAYDFSSTISAPSRSLINRLTAARRSLLS